MKTASLYEKALKTSLGSRFSALASGKNRPLTDAETRAEAKYQLADIPFKGMTEEDEAQAKKDMRTLLKA